MNLLPFNQPFTHCVARRDDYVRKLFQRLAAQEHARMPDHLPLVRQWILIKALSARRHGATVQEMAVELNVSEKTIRRDLQTFQEVGFPLCESVGDHGRKSWRIQSTSKEPDLSFAFDEALALYLGRRFLEPLAGTLLWEAAQSAFRKIRACLGPTALDYLETMAGHLHHTTIGASDYSKKADLIDQLMQAIEERRATHIGYRSQRATESVTYEIYPYGLAYHRGSLYLIAWSRDHNEVRHFKIDRLSEVEVSAFPFTVPDDFDLRTHLGGSFGIYRGTDDVTVRVRFSPIVARYVQESVWHESQRLDPQNDGSLLAEFQLSDSEEIKRWILSFGRHAVVLAPDSLRREVADEAAQLSAAYGEPVEDAAAETDGTARERSRRAKG